MHLQDYARRFIFAVMQTNEVREIILSLPNVTERHIEGMRYAYDFQNISFASLQEVNGEVLIGFSLREPKIYSCFAEYACVKRDKRRRRHNTFVPVQSCDISLLKELCVEAYHQASARSPRVYQPAYAATIGFFDGVHKGHRFLLEHLKQIGAEKGLRTMVITFDPSPLQILRPDTRCQVLSTTLEKERLIYECGIDEVLILRMDKEKLSMTAFDFMRNILKRQLNIHSLLLGHDHTFGSDRPVSRNVFDLYGKQLKMDIVHCNPYVENGIRISSSLIKQLVREGLVEDAEQMMGRAHQMSGRVVSGQQLGRQIGFPTANLELPPGKILPPDGVYAVWVSHEGERHKGILNIGKRPTLGEEQERTIEVHLLDFKGDLYGQLLTIDFIVRLRSEQPFNTLEDLQRQIQEDKAKAEVLLV